MTVGPRLAPSTSPGEAPAEPTRPICAELFISAFGQIAGIGPDTELEEVEKISQQALECIIEGIDYGSRLATPEEHLNCLGGRGITCWALGDSFDQLPFIVRSLPQTLTPVSIRGIERTLTTGSGSGPNPMYASLKKELHEQGLQQRDLPQDATIPPIGIAPIDVVPDPRIPSRVMEERIIKNPERRPPCASSFNQFIGARTEAINKYEERRRRARNPDRVKMDHTLDERFYDETIVHIGNSGPSQADCDACVINCPPKNGVSPKVAYDTIHRTVQLLGGNAMVPSDTLQLVLRGLPRSSLVGPPDPTEALKKIDSLQAKLAAEHGGEYPLREDEDF